MYVVMSVAVRRLQDVLANRGQRARGKFLNKTGVNSTIAAGHSNRVVAQDSAFGKRAGHSGNTGQYATCRRL